MKRDIALKVLKMVGKTITIGALGIAGGFCGAIGVILLLPEDKLIELKHDLAFETELEKEEVIRPESRCRMGFEFKKEDL